MIDDDGSAALDSGDPVIGALKRVFADLPRAETDATTDDPTTIGRYAVLRRVGSGATGVVYAAYDEELDRRVAIKLMRDRGARVSGAAARLRREAQALARISHPNVIGVHEVGEHRASDVEQVFIAMEFVRGQTLRRWCSAAGRTHREVIDVLLQAARGLAAVHDAGLVHRDVKPENVMIGDDGRVRLMDFGLARGDPHEQPRTSSNVDLGPAAVQITRSGAIAGTPAYMAPEQWSGGDVGTAADQFAFCVMAWEALYGARPFEDATVDTLAKTVREGPKQRGPGGTTVPARVRRILERGLAAAPADRWSSMGALLEALARVQRQAGRMRLIVLASVVALVVVGIAGAHRIDVMRRTAACEEAGSRDVAAWDDENRTAVRVSLSSTGVPYAADTADRVIPWLDERASALERGRTEACLDADVRGTWDAETFDRSSWCLDDQRSELEAIVHELAHADAQTVQHAVTAVAALPDPAWCRDVDRLSRLPAPPPEDRDDVNAIRRELARAGALERAGRYATALEVVDPALARARESSWTPLVAAALARRAALLHRLADYADAEATGREAYLEAARVGAWDIAAEVASELVAVVGAGLSRVDEGLFWGRHAEIALAHAGDPQQLAEARRLAAVATVFNGVARHEEARVASERALEINRAALAPNHPAIASGLIRLGHTYLTTADSERARLLFEESVAIFRESVGPDHPNTATALHNLGAARYNAGHYEEARAAWEAAFAIYERVESGTDHPEAGATLVNLAAIDVQLDELAQAKPRLERAIELLESGDGGAAQLAGALFNLGNVYYRERDLVRALGLFERALAIEEETRPRHPSVAISLSSIGKVLSSTGQHAEARRRLERALDISEKELGLDHPLTATVLSDLASIQQRAGDDAGAREVAERAVMLFDRHEGDQNGEPGGRFVLAQTLIATGGSHDRARREAEKALEQYRALADARNADRVRQWLAEHDEATRASRASARNGTGRRRSGQQ